jgi:chromosome segregation ATPase
MSASSEAMAMYNLVANGSKYRERLQELNAATEKADLAVANLKLAEKASDAKLEATQALHASLQGQVEEIQARHTEAASQIEAGRNDLIRREAALLELKQQHVAQVASALQDLKVREEELALKRAAVDEHVATQTRSLQEGQASLRAKNLELHSIVASARQGIAAIAA